MDLYIFDTGAGFPARCIGRAPTPDLDPVAATGNPDAVGVLADIPHDTAKSAITLEADGATVTVNNRTSALTKALGTLRGLRQDAANPLLESLLRLIVALIPKGGDSASGTLGPAELALLEDLRSRLIPNLSTTAPEDLDEAVKAKQAEKAILDGLPTVAAS